MKLFDSDKETPLLGIAHSDYINQFAVEHGHLFDYIEVPYELLKHNPATFEISNIKPIVLHCASLSIAGNTAPDPQDIKDIGFWIDKTQSPWLGEHLSFITAPNADALQYADEYAPGQPYNIGYTMPPPLNEQALDTVRRSILAANEAFDIPMILENPPIYFTVPGSEMDQIEFINQLVKTSDVQLLLDLAHFYITSQNEGFDALSRIAALPLDKVVEVHVSGVEVQSGIYWDHHASGAPDIIYRLLQKVTERAAPKAITLEFNWNSKFPEMMLLQEIQKVKDAINLTYCE